MVWEDFFAKILINYLIIEQLNRYQPTLFSLPDISNILNFRLYFCLNTQLEASDPESIKPVLNIIGVNSLRLGDLQLKLIYHDWFSIAEYRSNGMLCKLCD